MFCDNQDIGIFLSASSVDNPWNFLDIMTWMLWLTGLAQGLVFTLPITGFNFLVFVHHARSSIRVLEKMSNDVVRGILEWVAID